MAGGINIGMDPGIGKVEGLYNIYAVKDKPIEDISLNENLFQIALDKAVESLNRISAQDIKANALISEYVNGNVPLEEVIIQMEKASVAISLAMTVINSAVQTTKEILQMAV
jgi:flagellar hook-basal body complex protein FliE